MICVAIPMELTYSYWKSYGYVCWGAFFKVDYILLFLVYLFGNLMCCAYVYKPVSTRGHLSS